MDRQRPQVVPERERLAQRFQSLEVAGAYRRGSLHLDADDRAAGRFEHDVDLVAGVRAVVKDLRP